MFKIILTKQAQKDQKNIEKAGLKDRTKKLISVLKADPYQTPPPCEKLLGNLQGYYSRRINLQHRIVYQVLDNDEHLKDMDEHEYTGIVKIIRMWTHYDDVK